jgi:hypothetical protein
MNRLLLGKVSAGVREPLRVRFFKRGITMTPMSWLRFGAIALLMAWGAAMASARAEVKAKEFPKGSDKAVKAVKEALPKAEIDAVE